MNSSAFRIHETDPAGDDARWCLEQYYGELRDLFEEGFDPAKSLLADPGEMRRPHGVFVLARLAERAVGCGVVKLTAPDVGYIKRMWVDPQERGRGLGRELLRALESNSRPTGFSRVPLVSTEVKDTARFLRSMTSTTLTTGSRRSCPRPASSRPEKHLLRSRQG